MGFAALVGVKGGRPFQGGPEQQTMIFPAEGEREIEGGREGEREREKEREREGEKERRRERERLIFFFPEKTRAHARARTHTCFREQERQSDRQGP